MNMEQTISSSINKESDVGNLVDYGYSIKGGILIVILLLSSSSVVYHIIDNYVPYHDFIVMGKGASKEIYFLKSKQTIEKLGSYGINKTGYLARLKAVEKVFVEKNFTVKYIDEQGLSTLPIDSILFSLDTVSLDDQSIDEIKRYVSQGGFLVFNYHFAYNSEDKFRGNNVIKDITELDHPKSINHIGADGLYLSPKLLSPMTKTASDLATRVGLYSADALPVFVSSRGDMPDLFLSNWDLNSSPIIGSEDKQEAVLRPEEAGAAWHGHYKKGNWFYFSMPSYSLFSSEESRPFFEALLTDIVEFSNQPATIMGYPFLDKKKVAFISEDTEYQYSYFKSFINAAETYKIPVTAFCVSNLAEKGEYHSLMKEAGNSPYIEIGSHSHTHKKITETSSENINKEILGSKSILDKLAGTKVTGFRAPREELNVEMTKTLVDSGYEYVLGKNKGYTYPRVEHKGLYTIPRTATDDYQFLVNLEWNPDEIVKKMIAETEYVSAANGLYSLSVHTHLMSYKNNIKILEKYFNYLNKNPDITALSGQNIIDKVKIKSKISYKVTKTNKKFLIDVVNNNDNNVKQVKFRVFWAIPVIIDNINAEIIGTKVTYIDSPKDRFTDVTIYNLKPASSLKLIATYDVEK